MLQRLKNFLTSPEPSGDAAPQDRVRLAAAALLVRGATIDGHLDEAERKVIESLLASAFGLDAQATSELLEAAIADERQATDLFRWTQVLRDAYSHEERVAFMEKLWEVVLANGSVHDFESNLLRRVSGLIYVPELETPPALPGK